MCDDWYDDDEALDREAVRQLVERHRDEYDEIRRGTQRAEIDRLEKQARKNQERIRQLEEKLGRAQAAAQRRTERVASGVTKLGKRA